MYIYIDKNWLYRKSLKKFGLEGELFWFWGQRSQACGDLTNLCCECESLMSNTLRHLKFDNIHLVSGLIRILQLKVKVQNHSDLTKGNYFKFNTNVCSDSMIGVKGEGHGDGRKHFLAIMLNIYMPLDKQWCHLKPIRVSEKDNHEDVILVFNSFSNCMLLKEELCGNYTVIAETQCRLWLYNYSLNIRSV